MQQIEDWLKKLGPGQYAKSFANNGIDDLSILLHGLSHAVRDICTAVLESAGEIDPEIFDESRGHQFGITASYALLCHALLLRGHLVASSQIIEQGLSKCSLNNEAFFESELRRLKARAVLLGREPDANIRAQSSLEQALTTARSQSARSLELRAALDLARLLHDQGKRTEARDLLVPVCNRFTEGFDMPVLEEAKTPLEQLTA